MLPVLEQLIPVRRYDRFDYLELLKSLFPTGPLWNFLLEKEVLIRAQPIESGEAWGEPTITTGPISMSIDTGIPSSEAWGIPDVNGGCP